MAKFMVLAILSCNNCDVGMQQDYVFNLTTLTVLYCCICKDAKALGQLAEDLGPDG